ncbi:dihydrolipoamide acetyltransferase family protein [Glaciihabitans sp. UYNi722]|uniref:dihydrolipoamide acetyltransferase family protein n=1 Tax=Glaciihabitans sp. UYNi722 TaxID=3156344 RepID=UPI003398DAAE
MTTKEFRLPDLGEGLTESELVAWHVAVGDLVSLNQTIAEVESAKAVVQLPSPCAGVVTRLVGEPGATMAVGTVIAAFEVEDAPAPARNPVLVGYGAPVERTDRPQRRARSGVAASSGVTSTGSVAERPRSTPPVRRLAHDLGVELELLRGSGEDGVITREDVQAAASVVSVSPVAQVGETRTPISGVRKRTAEAMVSSAFTAPHVTEFLTVDVTPTVELVESLQAGREFREHRLTMLTVVAKAVCLAAARTPSVNSRWDEANREIVQFDHLNLGIAVATSRGLLVPNIPNAESFALGELADAITGLAETARAGTITPAQLSGGTFTISNIGVFGVGAGTPIINPGEAAILATGAVRRMPWEYRGEIALRQVMTLSLSFDHRLVDGEQGSRFLTDVGGILGEPGRVLAMV